MLYLKGFSLPGQGEEEKVMNDVTRTCYTNFYPFGLFTRQREKRLGFEPVTILCGGNGCGKSTLLNLIAECLGAERGCAYNRSSFFDAYRELCRVELGGGAPAACRIITSDDVFDYLLDLRTLNEGIDRRREELLGEYTQEKYARFQFRSMEDYEELKKVNGARRSSGSKFVKARVMTNIPGRSNGESALGYFTQKIQENGLYLLDEPENSLSAEAQLSLLKFLEDSARFYRCQFLISTHSPFLASLEPALIYDLDQNPVRPTLWTQLESVRTYHDFFEAHGGEFL